MMIARLMTASILVLGFFASTASAENGYCGKGATYDRETLTCVDNFGSTFNEDSGSTAGFSAGTSAPQADPGNVGDFIDETVTERNERSSR